MTDKKKLPLRFIVVATAIIALGAWYFWPRVPLPQQASRQFLEAVLREDYTWIYEHAFNEEKELPGFNEDLIREFCDDHLGELRGAQIVSPYSVYLDEPTRGMALATVRLQSGKEVKLTAQAFGEDGDILVGAMEGLFALRFGLDGELGRQRMSWATIRPWFQEHGVDQVYFAQIDQVFDLDDAKVHDPATTK
jgi:hypothetical protein